MVSNIGTGWGQTYPQTYPWVQPYVTDPLAPAPTPDTVGREEFEALRNEIRELRKLLIAAKEYDQATGDPDCEMDEKVALIKKVADLVGVDISDVFGD
jgi:hypothetical protein